MNSKTDFADRIRQLPADKRAALLAQLPPLSFAQQRFWFLQQLAPQSCSYNMVRAARLEGMVQFDALESALCTVVNRHEVLRTSIVSIDGEPHALLEPPTPVDLKQIDLRSLPETERLDASQHHLTRLAQEPFDLAQCPPLRAQLLRLDEEQYVFGVVLHHAAGDEISLRILFSELQSLYEALVQGAEDPLPEPRLQYADFARWQQARFRSGEIREQLDYWRERLTPLPDPLELIPESRRATRRSNEGRIYSTTLSANVSQELQQLQRRTGVTPFMLFLAAYKALLFRYTGRNDLAVGTPLTHRHHREFERLVGCCVNTVVIRTRIDGDTTFDQYLLRVKEAVIAALENQDAPFEVVVHELAPARDEHRSPIFQMMFAYENQPQTESTMLEAAELAVRGERVQTDSAKFDLTFYVSPRPGSYVLRTVYNSGLFRRDTIVRLHRNLKCLLAGIAQSPTSRISSLPLLDGRERALLSAWNATDVPCARPQSLMKQIEDTSAADPDRPAVVWDGGQLTYGQLDEAASRIASLLWSRGVRPETVVGVHLRRGRQLLPTLLGVLKTGAAYLGLDTALPPERLRRILEDARPHTVFTHGDLLSLVAAADPSVDTITIDEPLEDGDPRFRAVAVQADNLIYVLYTSGSTGLPKGVMNTHGALSNRITWMQRHFQLEPSDRVLHKTSLGFDVSFWEWCWPLVVGATVVLAADGQQSDAAYLVSAIRARRITTIHFVPSVLKILAEEEDLRNCRSLRRIICSGEAFPESLRQRCLRLLGDCELHNLYGPTEAAIDVTAWDCRSSGDYPSPPIGHPIDNTQISIVDRDCNRVPVGAPAELHIAGDCLARGYLNQPAKTAAQFVPNPYAKVAGSRMYRSGDIARFLDDGAIEYLRRVDDQIKLRGVRIELGEVETVINGHPDVSGCAARVCEPNADPFLAAFVVPRAGCDVRIDDVRLHASQWLSTTMVPSRWVVVPSLPLTASGKLDRKQLSVPDDARSPTKQPGRPPVGQLEETLAELFAELLGVDEVDSNDDFFALGGHSLLANRLIAAIRRRCDVTLPLREVFVAPTVNGLASLVANRTADSAESGLQSGARHEIDHLLGKVSG